MACNPMPALPKSFFTTSKSGNTPSSLFERPWRTATVLKNGIIAVFASMYQLPIEEFSATRAPAQVGEWVHFYQHEEHRPAMASQTDRRATRPTG